MKEGGFHILSLNCKSRPVYTYCTCTQMHHILQFTLLHTLLSFSFGEWIRMMFFFLLLHLLSKKWSTTCGHLLLFYQKRQILNTKTGKVLDSNWSIELCKKLNIVAKLCITAEKFTYLEYQPKGRTSCKYTSQWRESYCQDQKCK